VRLRSFAPDGFEAYTRVFHPAGYRPAGRGSDASTGTTWSALGERRGITLFADVSFTEVSGMDPEDQRGLDELAPMEGELPPKTCEVLAALLRGHTRTPELCWFCLWDGNGSLWSDAHARLISPDVTREEIKRYRAAGREQDAVLRTTPRVEAYARSYFLFRGPLEAACRFQPGDCYTSPNVWWPDDRSWIVITEVDGFSTYIGGSQKAIRGVITSPELEAVVVRLDTHMDPGAYRPWWR
jgi:hypothetical protein